MHTYMPIHTYTCILIHAYSHIYIYIYTYMLLPYAVHVHNLRQEMKAKGQVVYSLCVGEPDYQPPEEVLEATGATVKVFYVFTYLSIYLSIYLYIYIYICICTSIYLCICI